MRIIDEETQQEIFSPDLSIGVLSDPTVWASPEAYESIDNITKFAISGSDWETVRVYHRWTAEEIAEREQAAQEAARREEREKLLLTLSEAFSETYEPSDKEGFLFKVVKLGDVEIMREYVTDPDYDPESEDGSYLKPFKYIDGMEVIEAKWYWLDDKDLPHECIKSGVPASFNDAEYFDIVEGI